jgi:hypothetical protein
LAHDALLFFTQLPMFRNSSLSFIISEDQEEKTALKIEVANLIETSETTYQKTIRDIPEQVNLKTNCSCDQKRVYFVGYNIC